MAQKRLHLTPDLLRRYAAGLLTPAEQHAVERLLLDDPLAAEAAEGLARLREDGVDVKMASGELYARLQNRVAKRQGRVVPLAWTRYAAAATVLLAVAGLGWWWLRNEPVAPEPAMTASRPAPEAPQPAAEPAFAPAAPPEATTAKTPPPKTTPKRFSEPNTEVLAQEVAPAPAATAPPTADARKDEAEARQIAVQREQAVQKSAPLPAAAPRASPAMAGRALTGPRFTGRVLGENRQPVAGASVQVLGTTRGTTTDDEGRFALSGLSVGSRLRVAMVGYQRAEVILKDTSAITVMLQPDATALQEVVVTGYGAQAKRDVTGAVSTLQNAPEGGFAALEEHVHKNRRVAGQGTVTLSFRLTANGRPKQIRVQGSTNPSLNREAVRLLKTGPRWLAKKTTRRAGRVVCKVKFD